MTSPKIAMKRVRIGAGLIATQAGGGWLYGGGRKWGGIDRWKGVWRTCVSGSDFWTAPELHAIARFMSRLAKQGRGKR
jgi:hypothetical protein